MTGEATHQVIGGPRGLDEAAYVRLRAEQGIRSVAPVVEGTVEVDEAAFTVMGVDLFADNPLVFKKLIYELRFDEATVWYGEFGPFYTGLQFSSSELPKYLAGEVPAFHAP